MSKLKAYFQLMRPANMVTAISDIIAGLCIAGYTFNDLAPTALVLSTLGLYGGGVVMNDVFDAKLDAIERPERPIPSGKVPLLAARTLGFTLLTFGILAAATSSFQSGVIALSIALLTVLYNRFAKHHAFFGPVVMGMCRGGNLILGMSLFPESFAKWGWIALIPIVYIGAITMISQDEVHGGKQKTLLYASIFFIIVLSVQLGVSNITGNLLLTIPFVLLHAWLIGRPLYNAYQNPIGPLIGKAVKAGVITLIVMNASWCMAFGLWPIAVLTILLLPISFLLAKAFAVT